MKRIILILIISVSLIGCTKIESIEVIAPKRNIDTAGLQAYKSQLKNRNVSIGMIYGWGQLNQSNLMSTPDSLDIIVAKDGYINMDEHQKNDLAQTQKQKATKVLIGVDLLNKSVTFEQNLKKKINALSSEKIKEIEKSGDFLTSDQQKQIFKEIQDDITNSMSEQEKASLNQLLEKIQQLIDLFDGVSIEFPESYNTVYSADALSEFADKIQKIVSKNKNKLFILENPYPVQPSSLEKADWIVCKQNTDNQFLNIFSEKAKQWSESSFVPAIDFSNEKLSDGFNDTTNFPIQAQNMEICLWGDNIKAGVAFYHIEKDYTNMIGNLTYKSLRTSINLLQTK